MVYFKACLKQCASKRGGKPTLLMLVDIGLVGMMGMSFPFFKEKSVAMLVPAIRESLCRGAGWGVVDLTAAERSISLS